MRRVSLPLVVLLLSSRLAWAQGEPLGPEFRVNTYTTSLQHTPDVASDASGNFVVVWSSYRQDGLYQDTFGQRYDSSGAPLGPEFRVNTYTTASEYSPAVAADAVGNFVVVWGRVVGQYPAQQWSIFGQRFASSGTPLGLEFRVNSYVSGIQWSPSVAADASGNFVIVWDGHTAQDAGILGQRFASSGAPLGAPFRVNTYTSGSKQTPVVASDPSGDFVVVWEGVESGAPYAEIFAQRYASSGSPLGPEFRVNTHTASIHHGPAVALDSTGNFVVAWSSYQDGSYDGVFAQRYASSGSPLGSEFRVNAYTTQHQSNPSVASDSSGNFVVAWDSYGQAAPLTDVFAKRYASSGEPLSPEFRVNSYTPNTQFAPSVASDPSGNFVIVWHSWVRGTDVDVSGQRYGQIVPLQLTGFTVR